MKIELKKQITKVSGRIYYFVSIDGSMEATTWTTDYELAQKDLKSLIESAKKYPETVVETLEEVII